MSNDWEETEDDTALDTQRAIEKAEEDDVKEMFATMHAAKTPSGTGWFIPALGEMELPPSISLGDRFYSQPRATDLAPTDVPADHPFRAILAVLKQEEQKISSSDEDTIRLYAYGLSCPYMIDALIHYRKFFKVRVILEPKVHSLKMMKLFVDNISVNPTAGSPRTGLDTIEFRVANVMVHHGTTSMHRNQLLTSEFTTAGSYNMSLAARCYNWETLYILDTRDDDIQRFDKFWGKLADRQLSIFDPDSALFSPKEQKELSLYMQTLPKRKSSADANLTLGRRRKVKR
jgi:hypothetical protein